MREGPGTTPIAQGRHKVPQRGLDLTGTRRVWVLNAGLVAATAWLHFSFVDHLPGVDGPLRVPWWLLAGLFFLTEVGVVHVECRRNSHSISLSEIPLVLGLFFASPPALVGALVVGVGVALAMYRRQPPLKLVFNLAQLALGANLALIVFGAGAVGDPLGALAWSFSFLAVGAADAVAGVSLSAAISLSEGKPDFKALSGIFGVGTIPVFANSALALMGVTLLWENPGSIWLLAVPATTLLLAYRAYATMSQRYKGLEFLFETTRGVQHSADSESAVLSLLSRAQGMFRAERAEITFLPTGEGAPAFRTTLGAEEATELITPVALDFSKLFAEGAAKLTEAVLVTRPEEIEPWQRALSSGPIRDAMIAPLMSDDRLTGILLVVNRLGDVSSFDHEDLKLFATLANHASVLLEKGSLQQSLRRLNWEVAERKRVEEALRKAESKFRSLVEDVPAIVYISGREPEDPWAYVSPQVETVLGFAAGWWRAGPSWVQQLHAEDRDRVIAERRRAEETGSFVSEYRLTGRDGGVVWVSDKATLVRDGDRPLYFRGVLLDVSARRLAETQKEALELQLRQAQKMEAIGELAGGVAHDFNNLLAVIRNYAFFVSEDLGQKDPRQQDMQEILKASERAATLVRQLLTFSRREIIRPELMRLNRVVEDFQSLLRRALRENIDIVVRLDPMAWSVEADVGQLHQILLNLAMNAQDAMPDGGTLIVETSNVMLDRANVRQFDGLEPGPHACVAVSDTGMGMSPEVKARIFEPFFTTKGRTSGTGLGLSTVYGAIKRAHGDITVYSQLGVGTTFKLYLPARSAGLGGPDEGLAGAGARPGRGETILVAEDDPAVRNVVERILRSNGYRVVVASSADNALRLAETLPGPIDLLLTDVVMPERSGKSLCARLAKVRPGTRNLYMSGYPDEVLVTHHILGEDEDLLPKPFTAEQLLTAVSSALERPALLN
jgi:PAS domain S-box-containing protein